MKETEIIDNLSELCKQLIDDYSFQNALSILKAIIELDNIENEY